MAVSTDEPKVIGAELKRVTERQVIALVLDITADLIIQTPVDTGWAKSNWVPSVVAPEVELFGSRDSVDQSAQQRGQAEVLSYILEMGPVWITNNVPYIGLLNEGWSPKAQPGFVDMAVEWHTRRLGGKVFT